MKIKQTGHRTIIARGDQKGWLRTTIEVMAWVAGIAILVITVLLNWETIIAWF